VRDHGVHFHALLSLPVGGRVNHSLRADCGVICIGHDDASNAGVSAMLAVLCIACCGNDRIMISDMLSDAGGSAA
jgi:hypothetical protein